MVSYTRPDGAAGGAGFAGMADEHDGAAAPVPVDQPVATASVPLMITRRQRVDLRALGVSAEAIATMTPVEAHALLRLHAPRL